MGFFDFMQEAIAIDLGTANTLIIHNDKVVVDQPSIVAKNIRTGEVVAIGKRAQQMHGKTHKEIETIRQQFHSKFKKEILSHKKTLNKVHLDKIERYEKLGSD